ncbi:hypothetical protein [Uliginosibacterium sediminicola]|uniref:Uncharacterized protein n=1 Tax=Uliginosibacterium sediminicola TaxID=2024550 RepID=A0ABU9YZV7_9RHOO
MSPNKITERLPLAEIFVLIVFSAVGIWVFYVSAILVSADFKSMRARDTVDGWMARRNDWSLSAWIEARSEILDALKVVPDSPMLNDYMGAIYSFRGIQSWKDDRLRVIYFKAAEAYQLRSIQFREHNAPAWASLALSRYAIGLRDDQLYTAVQQAINLGESEPGVRRVVSDILLGTWRTSPTSLRQWLLQNYPRMSSQEKQTIMSIAQRYGQEKLLTY